MRLRSIPQSWPPKQVEAKRVELQRRTKPVVKCGAERIVHRLRAAKQPKTKHCDRKMHLFTFKKREMRVVLSVPLIGGESSVLIPIKYHHLAKE